MITEFRFPDVGEGITEGEIVKWRIGAGDAVEEDQIIAEVETDKAVVEIPSPMRGVVIKLHHREGDMVKVGEVLVTLGGEGDLRKEEVHIRERKDAGTVVGVLEEAEEEAFHRVLATPVVRKMAKDMGIELGKVKGTGTGGRITKEDLEGFVEKKKGVRRDKDAYGDIVRVPLKGIRRTIAKNMPLYQHATAHVTHMDEADVTELSELKAREGERLKEKGTKLTYLPFIIKAVIAGLKIYPCLNATLNEESQEIIIKKYYNIGTAVDTEDGLMVPVIKNADKRTLIKLAEDIEEIAEKARSRSIELKDLKGGTFTITNIGAYGGTYATPIINHPEVAILAAGKIQDRPVVRDAKIVVRKLLPLSITFDHRVMDGGMVARFAGEVIRHLEDPGLLLLELR